MSRTDESPDATPQHHHGASGRDEQHGKEHAAQVIQRNYRGYRTRRQLEGMGLDANARWAEAIKQAKWHQATKPRAPTDRVASDAGITTPEGRSRAASNAARQNWKRVGEITRRAGADDPDDASEDEDQMGTEERRAYRRKKVLQKAEREKTAKMMDLQYFLEMVDQKHRYGSNLRAYHDQWKKSDVNENFFFWLDQGSGKTFEHPTVTRERLEKEQVRYLSREERMKYLVQIDDQGRLCWAKNGERINTSLEYKDSVDGVVPIDDATPAYQSGGRLSSSGKSRSSSSASTSSDSGEHSDVEGEHYVNHDLDKATGLAKIKYVSAATVLNHLLRGSVKPNSWIFVADTSFRLYIGIKQSGAFQHSSFLHGARISAAGLIKIKDGKLRRLSPLSGHYRPPTKNFRTFVHSLQERGVDMSRVSISRSYAVLVGLEAYTKTRKKLKQGVTHVADVETKVIHPEEYKHKMEEEKDKSESAEKERQLLAHKVEEQQAARKEHSWRRKIWKKLSISPKDQVKDPKEQKRKKALSKPGEDVESAIPPAGQRDGLHSTSASPAS